MQLIEENSRLKEQVNSCPPVHEVSIPLCIFFQGHLRLSRGDLKLQVTRMARMEMQLGAESEVVYEEGQSSESVTNASYPRPSADTDDGGSDTSLRLGLPLFSSK
jgi:hypothetical protein